MADADDTGPPDFTDQYNTRLSADQQTAYDAWAARQQGMGRDVNRDSFDYDMKGWWKANGAEGAPDLRTWDGTQWVDTGHLTDTFKKPNHPTFSTGSKYSTDDTPGGMWTQGDNGQWTFFPSATNKQHWSQEALSGYFDRAERPRGNDVKDDRAKRKRDHRDWYPTMEAQ